MVRLSTNNRPRDKSGNVDYGPKDGEGQHSELVRMDHEYSWNAWSHDDPYEHRDYYGGYSPPHQYCLDHGGKPTHDEDIACKESVFDM
ncbi:hypothetical protein HAX54_022318 [Datura stramonium]|uniref:Uncharacterized protein n=1 Tax=Datura stramonium TaxID=4076 RepID=A0ABS8UWK2_DATST|nr:hypothetical protein [Datura stramonium]